MFQIGSISATFLLCSILAWTNYASGCVHDHVFDVTGTVDPSDGTPLTEVEVILDVDKPVYDGVTPVKSQRLVTSKGAYLPVSNSRLGYDLQSYSSEGWL